MKIAGGTRSGFTLIELLVVVTLIAILSIAVLATVNPIEQRNKGRDTSVKQTAAEYIAAQERYFATYGCYTWNADSSSEAGDCDNTTTLSGAPAINSVLHNNYLEDSGEIKGNLLDRISVSPYNGIFLIEDSDRLLHARFQPASQSFDIKANCNLSCVCGGAGPNDVWYCVPDVVE